MEFLKSLYAVIHYICTNITTDFFIWILFFLFVVPFIKILFNIY